jgi:rubrerythrin
MAQCDHKRVYLVSHTPLGKVYRCGVCGYLVREYELTCDCYQCNRPTVAFTVKED